MLEKGQEEARKKGCWIGGCQEGGCWAKGMHDSRVAGVEE